MNRYEHDRIEEWAKKYAGLALMGFLCTLLIVGKFVHYIFLNRGLICGIFVIPPALISGIIGLIWFAIMDKIDPVMTDDLAAGLEMMKSNLLNFVFASLMLGLCCSRSSSKHITMRGVLTSVLHEGMPMVIYSQILTWGQTSLCLAIICLSKMIGLHIPSLFAAMVPLGVEAGNDVVPTPVYNNFWSVTVVEEAESLGIVVASVLGVMAISAKPFLLSSGWLGSAYSRETSNSMAVSVSDAEAFGRSTSSRLVSSSSLNPLQRVSYNNQTNSAHHSTAPAASQTAMSSTKLEEMYRGDKADAEKSESYASLGTHLSIVALTVFLSFNAGLTARIFETQFSFLKAHRIFSGICMYKLSMCCALISMNFFLRRSRIRFRRDWFMRLCGLMLDMLVIAALSTANPKPKSLKDVHYGMVAVFVTACVGWNVFSFFFLARRLFPNFWYERGLTLSGNALGHSFMGLLFARTLDPTLETPAPIAYAYKLMIFFIPSSGGKNNIVVSIVDVHGIWVALLVCLCVVTAWLIIFDKHFKHRFVKHNRRHRARERDNGKDSSSENEHSPDEEVDGLLSFDSEDEDKSTHSMRRDQSTTSLSQMNKLEMVPSVLTNIQTEDNSMIITPSQMAQMAKWLPETELGRTWVLKYSLRQDGASLETLMSNCTARALNGRSVYSSCFIVVEDSWGYIFGGYVAHDLQNNNGYYGNGEDFVYSLTPKPDKFKWTGENDFFVISNNHQLAMGGGGEGFSFQLDDELDTGVSNRSDTYSNPVLSSNEFFKCLNVEIWTLENVGFSI
mmetsp:Transcript_37893/g.38579  ORF Transcript_37893/g.38579 Transcript_37893/m.38579 type:complete len:787 (-) Transcript_37893:26-2386(-)